jgi:AcrR family transcriptional regulator
MMHSLGTPTSRERIKSAARQELNDSGILGLRMEVVAEKAQVSVPLIYKYYKNREGLLTEVLSELYDGDSYEKFAVYVEMFEQMESPTIDDIAIMFATVQQGFRSVSRWKRLQILAASAEIPELRARLAAIHLDQQQRVVDFLQVAIRAVASKYPGMNEESISTAVNLASPLASLIMTQSFGSVLDDLVDYEDREAAAEEMKVLLRLIVNAVLTAGHKSP